MVDDNMGENSWYEMDECHNSMLMDIENTVESKKRIAREWITMEISKRDWKLFKDKIGAWQETYMEKIVGEYIALLNDGLTASSKFWEQSVWI